MFKRKKVKKLGRGRDARRALLRGLAYNLFDKRKIETSQARSKVLRGFVGKIVKIAKKNTLTSRRQLLALLGGKEKLVAKITKELGQEGELSGKVTLVRLGERRGDSSKRVRIELETISKEETAKKKQES